VAAATMMILICAGWYRTGMIRRELTHSKSVDFGFPYHIGPSRVLLSKPWASTLCSVHCRQVALFVWLLHAYASSARNRKQVQFRPERFCIRARGLEVGPWARPPGAAAGRIGRANKSLALQSCKFL
jgi:hypothetical protein